MKWFKISLLLGCFGLFIAIHFGLPKLIIDTKASQMGSHLKPPLNQNQHYVQFTNQENDTLSAVLSTAIMEQRGTIMLLHGIRGYKEYFQRLSVMLNDSGYNTLAVDLRAHGGSSGDYCTYGYYEKYDVQSAVDYLLAEKLDSNVGIWGQSLGGAIALQALAIEPRLKFGIVESTFSEFTTIVDDYSERMFGFSIPLVNDYALYRASKIANFEPENVSPRTAAKMINQPMFIAHGTADKHIKFEYGKDNFDNLASENKVFLPIKGAVHHNVWNVGGASYFDHVFNFLTLVE